MNPQISLRIIKTIHTIAWGFFAGCIIAIPIYTWLGNLQTAAILCGIVFLEVLILFFNNWQCPLTPVAARYTDNRQDNFDIYLPLWVARYNKEIFGTLYVIGIIYTIARWIG